MIEDGNGIKSLIADIDGIGYEMSGGSWSPGVAEVSC